MTVKIKPIKVGDIVKSKDSGKIGIISAIQIVHNRYQLRGGSGWLYVTDDLEKVEHSSLITTIESQQEKLTKYSNLFLSLEASFLKFLSLTNIKIDTHPSVELQAEAVNQFLESQKEEIENFRDLVLTSNKMYTEISLRESDLNDEIDRYKAITELAVNGLQMIRRTSDSSAVRTYQRMEEIADKILSEIERLQNE